jgi:hypothetical protein
VHRKAVLSFLSAIQAENIEDSGGEWVHASCPFASYLHEKGTDSRPSFGIRVGKNGKSSVFHCFSCATSGLLQKLVYLVWVLSGIYPAKAATVIWDEEMFESELDSLTTVRTFPIEFKIRPSTTLVPVEITSKYPLVNDDVVIEWLHVTRKISDSVIEHFGIREARDLYDESMVVFPVLTVHGEVADLYARYINQKRFFRMNAAYTESDVDYKATHLFFGGHGINIWKPIWIVEGAIDCMRLHTLGITNTIACLGGPKREQFSNLYAPAGVVLAFDADLAGRRFTEVGLSLVKTDRVWRVDWGSVGITDPGELESKDQLREAVKSIRRLRWR